MLLIAVKSENKIIRYNGSDGGREITVIRDEQCHIQIDTNGYFLLILSKVPF